MTKWTLRKVLLLESKKDIFLIRKSSIYQETIRYTHLVTEPQNI
jgi:hypothetical protein